MNRMTIVITIAVCAALCGPLRAGAQIAPASSPIHVIVGKPLTRVTDVLADISKQSGIPILADDTVVDTLGVTTIDKPNLEDMLRALVALAPGLSWQRVYLPQDGPLPDANILSAQVRTLKAITATGLVVQEPGDRGGLTFSKEASLSPVAPDGMRLVYLVTNETVRAQREADARTAKRKAAAAAPVETAVNGLSSVADDFSQMSPDQQREAIPQMMQQMMRMIQSIDPGVRQELQQRWQQNHGRGGGR
jgi:hypothetical protein